MVQECNRAADKTVQQISDIQLLHDRHLYWPSLDVDLSFGIIEHPEKYTISQESPTKSSR